MSLVVGREPVILEQFSVSFEFLVADRQNVYLVRSTAEHVFKVNPIAVDWWGAEKIKPEFAEVLLEGIPMDLKSDIDPRLRGGIPILFPPDPLVTGDHLRIVFNSGKPFELDGRPIGPNGELRDYRPFQKR